METVLKATTVTTEQQLQCHELEDMLKQADTDGDGQINYKEFVVMMNSQ